MSDHTSQKRRHHRSGGRLFDYGELRLLVLMMIAEEPRHGYELIKLIEERFDGAYSPSPGVMYPTLAWLNDMGYTSIDTASSGGRKSYGITKEGHAFLTANRTAAEALLTRVGPDSVRIPGPILQAVKNLKIAIRLRLKEKNLDEQSALNIAAAIDAAAKLVENRND
ncbi:PadR family transcriptional regulator [Sneathiella sp. HT1-7]|uniref:PadR family transcriptional regulator n=1 Tax=Sneathiella sp. HT1-7 TaxID=2887192 RepID=UPI001D14FBAE|nr:PadR family transcriptional regulator [Sneathiella sp. HT1-7]MCC3305851.1 PadR family transcriptional regulator [Sneathiella sp. HT1-7]